MSKERAAQLVDAGIWLRLSGDIEGARRLFERALKLDPENQRAQDLLAQAPSTVVEPPTQPVATPLPSIGIPGSEGEGSGVHPAASPSTIAEDWGRLTGRGTPLPQTVLIPPPEAPALELGEQGAPRTSVMFAPTTSRGSPAPGSRGSPVPGSRGSPVPITRDSPVPPAIAPVISGATPVPQPPPVTRLTPIPTERTTLPYGSGGSPPPAPMPRQTLMLTPAPSLADAVTDVRQTLPFGGASPVPAPEPIPRITLPFNAATPAQRSTFPPLDASDAELSGPARHTQLFSGSIAGPLGPSAMPDVAPMVIHIDTGEGEAASGPDELVEQLKQQVNQGAASRQPRVQSIVLGDGAPEPAEDPASAPVLAEAPEVVPHQSPASAIRTQDAIDAAWNWSASPPPATRGVESPPTPRPSPGLVPQASSGWDQRGMPGIKIDDMVGPDNTLEFVSTGSQPPRSPDTDREEVETLLRGARDLIDLDDHTGAMELISRAQSLAPDDPQVQQLKERSERTLLAMFESKLGRLEKIPRVMLKDDEIIWLNLDHRAGFVLAQIDGTVSFEDLFAVSGMSRLDTARILAQLVDEGVISRG